MKMPFSYPKASDSRQSSPLSSRDPSDTGYDVEYALHLDEVREANGYDVEYALHPDEAREANGYYPDEASYQLQYQQAATSDADYITAARDANLNEYNPAAPSHAGSSNYSQSRPVPAPLPTAINYIIIPRGADLSGYLPITPRLGLDVGFDLGPSQDSSRAGSPGSRSGYPQPHSVPGVQQDPQETVETPHGVRFCERFPSTRGSSAGSSERSLYRHRR